MRTEPASHQIATPTERHGRPTDVDVRPPSSGPLLPPIKRPPKTPSELRDVSRRSRALAHAGALGRLDILVPVAVAVALRRWFLAYGGRPQPNAGQTLSAARRQRCEGTAILPIGPSRLCSMLMVSAVPKGSIDPEYHQKLSLLLPVKSVKTDSIC